MSRRLNSIRPAGVGLVEVMVATLVGAIVVIAVIQIFVANKQTFRMQDAMSVTQETGTFALDFIVRDALRAGYPGGKEAFNAFDWTQTTNGAAGANDTLAIVYRADSPDVAGTLCTGDTVTVATARIRNRYWVNADGDLMCQGDEEDAANVFQPVGNPQVLVSNVESFQVMFGVDLSHPVDQTPDPALGCPAPAAPVPQSPTAYVNADHVQAAIARGANDAPNCYAEMSERQVVRSVRIGLLVATEGQVDAVTPAGTTYTVLDATAAPDVSDGRLRRQFTKTVILRNIEEYL